MKNTKQSPTRSKSARHNGRAGNDTNRNKNTTDEGVRFCIRLPAGAFDKIAAEVAKLDKRKAEPTP
jgi:hypothetical protein